MTLSIRKLGSGPGAQDYYIEAVTQRAARGLKAGGREELSNSAIDIGPAITAEPWDEPRPEMSGRRQPQHRVAAEDGEGWRSHVDEYYVRGDEPPGIWYSPASKLVADRSVVAEEAMRTLAAGRTPDGRCVRATTNHSSGWDLTFSPPKDLSVAWAFMSGKRADIERVVLASARKVLEHAFERGFIVTRSGKDGVRTEVPKDIAVAMFLQHTSRAGDPQLHVHCVLENICVRRDGQVRTLSADELHRWKTYLGACFRAETSKRLHDLGIATAKEGRSYQTLGLDDRLPPHFSKRRAAIKEGLSGRALQLARFREALEAGLDRELEAQMESMDPGARRKLADRITTATRNVKGAAGTREEFEGRWMEELATFQDPILTPQIIQTCIRQAHAAYQAPDRTAADLALEEALAHESVTSERTLLRLVAEHAQGRRLGIDDIDAQYRTIIERDDIRILGCHGDGDLMLSTAAAIERERRMLLDALERVGEGPAVPQEAIAQALAAPPSLTEEQREAVRQIGRPDGVVCLEGAAGVGKSYSLKAVKAAVQACGLDPLGVAPSHKAKEIIAEDTGLHARTLQSLLNGLDRGSETLTARSFVIVDEAGMVSTADMARLLGHARSARARVLLTGDRRQLEAIAAGGPFALLADRLGVTRISEIQRLKVGWQKQAGMLASTGQGAAALEKYEANKALVWGANESATMDALVADWRDDIRAHPLNTRIAMASANKAVHELNRRMREVMRGEGHLTGPDVIVRTIHSGGQDGHCRAMALATGDLVIFGEQLRQFGIENGHTARVVGVTPGGRKQDDPYLVLRLDRGDRIVQGNLSEFVPTSPGGQRDRSAAPRIQHAYCTTIHKGQGQTRDAGFLYAGEGLNARALYVGLTRQRWRARAYVNAGGIRARLAESGIMPTHEAVRARLHRMANRTTSKLNVAGFVADVPTWLETGRIDAEPLLPVVPPSRRSQIVQRARERSSSLAVAVAAIVAMATRTAPRASESAQADEQRRVAAHYRTAAAALTAPARQAIAASRVPAVWAGLSFQVAASAGLLPGTSVQASLTWTAAQGGAGRTPAEALAAALAAPPMHAPDALHAGRATVETRAPAIEPPAPALPVPVVAPAMSVAEPFAASAWTAPPATHVAGPHDAAARTPEQALSSQTVAPAASMERPAAATAAPARTAQPALEAIVAPPASATDPRHPTPPRAPVAAPIRAPSGARDRIRDMLGRLYDIYAAARMRLPGFLRTAHADRAWQSPALRSAITPVLDARDQLDTAYRNEGRHGEERAAGLAAAVAHGRIPAPEARALERREAEWQAMQGLSPQDIRTRIMGATGYQARLAAADPSLRAVMPAPPLGEAPGSLPAAVTLASLIEHTEKPPRAKAAAALAAIPPAPDRAAAIRAEVEAQAEIRDQAHDRLRTARGHVLRRGVAQAEAILAHEDRKLAALQAGGIAPAHIVGSAGDAYGSAHRRIQARLAEMAAAHAAAYPALPALNAHRQSLDTLAGVLRDLVRTRHVPPSTPIPGIDPAALETGAGAAAIRATVRAVAASLPPDPAEILARQARQQIPTRPARTGILAPSQLTPELDAARQHQVAHAQPELADQPQQQRETMKRTPGLSPSSTRTAKGRQQPGLEL